MPTKRDEGHADSRTEVADSAVGNLSAGSVNQFSRMKNSRPARQGRGNYLLESGRLRIWTAFGSEAAPFEKRGVQFAVKHRRGSSGKEGRRGHDECKGFKLYDGTTLNKSKISQVLTGRGDETRVSRGSRRGENLGEFLREHFIERTPNSNEFPDCCDEYK
ncbi:hypothetical protein K0M31_000010 [Melipona bicolor]|uniref:Uncharacterized protein n=1 Tax=Melipona bicolor TaxID=60889 RepID=A0AA40GCX5_9HYME|nr:hypothetical protein K0M31_000010 [Melipona bicolor]